MDEEKLLCPVCKANGVLLDVVDFNKSCEEARGKHLPLAGIPVYYVLCDSCRFCWALELNQWPLAKFKDCIYNADYISVDPDYLEVRPTANAKRLRAMFPNLPSDIRHLDYGGGNGLLSKLLRESNWDSVSYDPFVDGEVDPGRFGRFDFITAYEVFEHVPDLQILLTSLCALLTHNSLLLFSTLISDGNIETKKRLDWWYASPRNGHISLFSRKSLSILAEGRGFKFGSFSNGLHVFYKTMPVWAKHLIRD
jgi:SAM-dependent methyltransferase